jgi:hypothetical protein
VERCHKLEADHNLCHWISFDADNSRPASSPSVTFATNSEAYDHSGGSRAQGCQMEYFQTQNTNFGNI